MLHISCVCSLSFLRYPKQFHTTDDLSLLAVEEMSISSSALFLASGSVIFPCILSALHSFSPSLFLWLCNHFAAAAYWVSRRVLTTSSSRRTVAPTFPCERKTIKRLPADYRYRSRIESGISPSPGYKQFLALHDLQMEGRGCTGQLAPRWSWSPR